MHNKYIFYRWVAGAGRIQVRTRPLHHHTSQSALQVRHGLHRRVRRRLELGVFLRAGRIDSNLTEKWSYMKGRARQRHRSTHECALVAALVHVVRRGKYLHGDERVGEKGNVKDIPLYTSRRVRFGSRLMR